MSVRAALLLVAFVQTLSHSAGQATVFATSSEAPPATDASSPQPSSESLPAATDGLTTAAAASPFDESSPPAASSAASSRLPQAAAGSTEDPPLPRNPGLVAVICIFVSILVIGAVVILVKSCRHRQSAFQKLDEVPMAKVTEEYPFAQHSAEQPRAPYQ
ncbi:UNVERIFIED_CONTAM: hypothetical protein K2H54_023494 [Gekko kuhli]